MLDRLDLRLAYTHDESGHQKGHRISELPVDKSAFARHKVILLFRDPRDVTVSGYFLASRRRKLFGGTLSDFLRDERHGLRKVLHFNRTWYENRHRAADFLPVRYEGMRQEPQRVLRRLIDFIGREVDDAALDETIDFCRFDNMRRLEREGYFEKEYGVLLASSGDDPDAGKVRRGKVGGYADTLSAADIAYCDRVIRASGYPLLAPVPGEA
ncbi:MAG: sulfotransferase domain-containing protein [Acidobacteriota bacterium]